MKEILIPFSHDFQEKDDKSWSSPTTVLLTKSENDKDYKTKNVDISKLHALHEISSQPTIILKTRDGETRALSPNQTHQVSAVAK